MHGLEQRDSAYARHEKVCYDQINGFTGVQQRERRLPTIGLHNVVATIAKLFRKNLSDQRLIIHQQNPRLL
jgi:hypothetical protein